ncbi:TraR/DksA C4-type zinc finger protein [Amphibacillus sp. Q70]|uniref:TraR/DksA C4-type zinc finger protein n=1 Tax=Amphibacillus sp. Q70 TaxID=3453416 RepID=UPI003F873B71
MLKKDDITQIKHDLITRETELMDKIKRDKIRATEEEYSTELSDYDNHPGDQGTELYEREKDLALTTHEQNELNEIKQALESIENGHYGQCIVCGNEIETDRLKAVPETNLCIEHADSKAEFNGEEQQSMGSLEFDETNSWNILEGYGSSESPSDFTSDHDDYNHLTEKSDSDTTDDMDHFANKNQTDE